MELITYLLVARYCKLNVFLNMVSIRLRSTTNSIRTTNSTVEEDNVIRWLMYVKKHFSCSETADAIILKSSLRPSTLSYFDTNSSEAQPEPGRGST